jgi:hypothetical protein
LVEKKASVGGIVKRCVSYGYSEAGLGRLTDLNFILYPFQVDFTRLKSDIQLLERNDFTLMKTENERLMTDVEKLKQKLREEITRTTAGVRLDLNLEKGRIRDESSVHALKIKEVDTRIESEIAGLRSLIATVSLMNATLFIFLLKSTFPSSLITIG